MPNPGGNLCPIPECVNGQLKKKHAGGVSFEYPMYLFDEFRKSMLSQVDQLQHEVILSVSDMFENSSTCIAENSSFDLSEHSQAPKQPRAEAGPLIKLAATTGDLCRSPRGHLPTETSETNEQESIEQEGSNRKSQPYASPCDSRWLYKSAFSDLSAQGGPSDLQMQDSIDQAMTQRFSLLPSHQDSALLYPQGSRRRSALECQLPEGLTITEAFSRKAEQKTAAFSENGSRLSVDSSGEPIGAKLSGNYTVSTGGSCGGASIQKASRNTKRPSATMDMGHFLKDGQGYYADQAYRLIDVPDSSPAARKFAYAMNVFIIFSIVMPLTQSVREPPLKDLPAAVIEVTIEVLFLLEMLVRFIATPDKRRLFSIMHTYIDIAAELPLILRAAIGFTLDLKHDDELIVSTLVCIVPILRMLKLLRRFQKFLLLQRAFADAAEALPVLLYTLATIWLVFSTLIYLVEPRDNIETYPDAVWMTIVTMTTVGYGDKVPKSTLGSCVTAVLIISSALYMAMPLGIIGATFTSVWKQRDCILLVHRARDEMDQRGYTAFDIPSLFKLFDSDKDGELGRADFIRMIESMHIVLPTDRVLALFEAIDSDGGGSIDAIEFIRHVFPKEFAELYEDELPSDEPNIHHDASVF